MFLFEKNELVYFINQITKSDIKYNEKTKLFLINITEMNNVSNINTLTLTNH